MRTWPSCKTSEATRERKGSPSLAFGGGEAVKQANANGGSFADFAGGEGRRVHDIAVGVAGRSAGSRPGWAGGSGAISTMPLSVPSSGVAERGIGLREPAGPGTGIGAVAGAGWLKAEWAGEGLSGRGRSRNGQAERRSRRIAGDDGVVRRRIRSALIRAGLLGGQSRGGRDHQCTDEKGLLDANLHFGVSISGRPAVRRHMRERDSPWSVRHSRRQRVARKTCAAEAASSGDNPPKIRLARMVGGGASLIEARCRGRARIREVTPCGR